MATSGSTDYSVSRNNLIKQSLRIIGAVASGETPSADEISEANETLNQLLKSWSADGIHLWTRSDISNTLIVGKSKYLVGPNGDINTTRPVEIQYAYRRDTSNKDMQLTRISMQEYWRLPDKSTSNGTVVQYAYNPVLGNGELYVWPPESTANCVIHLMADLPIEDMDSSANDFQLPQEWLTALKWALAAELAPEYSQDLNYLNWLTAKAEAERDKVLGFDMEQSSVFFQPARY